jgi:methyl-accepting chemotaxis protein
MFSLESLPFKRKLQVSVYSIIAVYSIALLFVSLKASGIAAIIGFVVLIVMIAASFPLINWTERLLTDQISTMARVAMSIAKGDFSQKVDASSKDTVGELGVAFNSMIDKLRDILKETSTITKHVSDSSREIFTKNEHLRDVLGQVTISATEMAAGAGEISEEVQTISQSTKDIAEKVTDYALSTREMNTRSQLMIKLTEKGRGAVELQGEGMKRNVESTSRVSETIHQLADQAAGISKITRTISDIAEQTNLLSLNASIEAARAGEHGRGFAVVAQQVRKLAEESTVLTKEVFGLVSSIEKGIKLALENIGVNEQVVNKQTDLIKDTEQLFGEIVTSVQFISEEISKFASESDSMLGNTRQISATMENISSITQQSAAGTEEVSASMNEQISAVTSIVEKSEEMTRMVTKLQQTIHIFKF